LCNLSSVLRNVRPRGFDVGAAALVAVVVCASAHVVAAGQPPSAQAAASGAASHVPTDADGLFRVFLNDGTSIASVGEVARVGDRVVFPLPLSATRQPMASVAASEVDWTRTDRYANAVRGARYAATRGEADFAAMSAIVARTLSDVAVTPGRGAQLALAERARRLLADWPRGHYGYRADDVRQTLGLLDEVIAGLRAATGETKFDVSLVAGTLPPPAEPTLAPPTLKDAIEQALRLSTLAGSAAERVMLLEQAEAALGELSPTSADAAWVDTAKTRAVEALRIERRTDAAYRDLATVALRDADRRLARSDVRGLLKVRTRVVERDRLLGSKRPDEIQALVAAIDQRLDAARRLRLAQDRWLARAPMLRAWRDAVRPTVERLREARSLLSDIRTLAGPPLAALAVFSRDLDRATPFVRALTTPAEAADASAALQSALQLAGTATAYRERAITNNDMRAAWDASAAAAGALLFFERADTLVGALLVSPAAATRATAPAPRQKPTAPAGR
jgi:hypothetical protein